MMCVNHEMQNLYKELTEKLEKKTGGITGSRGVPQCAGKEAPGRPSNHQVQSPQRLQLNPH
jgi:hypothetical protein